MSTRKNIFRMCFAALLAIGLAACGGGASKPEPTAQENCEAADGRWNDDGTCTSAAQLAVERQQMAISEAIAAAKTAVDGLSATSTDAEVDAAKTLVDAARTALSGADLLSANQVFVLGSSLTAVEGTLAKAKMDIAAHRKQVDDDMKEQRTAANTAISAANTAVAGLSATSTDEDVQAAEDAIQAAKDAVTAATALSEADREAMSQDISTIETTLAGTKSDIDDHRQMVADEEQRQGVRDAIDAAMAAVDGLSVMSTDEEVDAAKDLIAAAEAALSGATSVLTAEQALALQGRISTIEGTLDSTETAIAAYRKKADDDAEDQRKLDVASARMKAMQSYMSADADAGKAETAADAAEETAPGSAGAMAARAAATAARTAADNAKAAHDAITDDMTKAEADAQAEEAATEAGTANSSYMTAKAENDAIQTADRIGKEQQRTQAIADARSFGGAAVANAKQAADDAQAAADAAGTAATKANNAYMQAVNGRTDATEAKKHADAADAAHTAAQAAADAANDAYMAAKAAIDGVMDDSTTEEAKAARMTAESEEDKAATSKTTAMTQQADAEDALADAQAAQGEHVLSLLMAANDVDQTNAKTRAARIKVVAGRIAAAAASTGNRNDSRDSGEATATVIWDENTEDDPDTSADETVTRYVRVTIADASNGVNTQSQTQNVDANDDGDFDDDGDTKANAIEIKGLPGFTHGQDVSTSRVKAGATANDGHVIVFTNKVQDTAAVTAKAAVSAKSLTNDPVSGNTVTKVGATSGTTIPGVTYFEGTDTADKRAAYTGTLTCAANAECSVTVGGTSDSPTYTVEGYTFTGTRKASPAVTESDGVNNDYLVFGVWMDDVTTPVVGAFANGPTTFSPGAHTDSGDDNTWAALVGTATYNGAATGLYTQGTSVDYFQGDAKLTADFDKIGTGETVDDELGTITGTISNIMAGGVATGDVINLHTDATPNDGNITDAGAFAGAAVMGAYTVKGSVVTYPYNGTWSGQFRGPSAESGAKGAATLPPDAVGTFGVTGTDDMGTTGTADDVTTSYVGAFGASQ